MTSVSHNSTSMFRCAHGDHCDFFKLCDNQPKHHCQTDQESIQPDTELSYASKLIIDIAAKGIWAGVGAATNYLSGGNPFAGALFNPLTSEVSRFLHFIDSQLPLPKTEDMSLGANLAKSLLIKGTSMFAVAKMLHSFGYSVTKTTLVVNSTSHLVAIALGVGLLAAVTVVEAGAEGIAHMHYHKIPCPCPDKNPEIEEAEKFLKDYQNQIPADLSVLLQSKIEVVKQANAHGKDIQNAKEQLVFELDLAKKLKIDSQIVPGVTSMSFIDQNPIENVQIVTVDSSLSHILRTKTEDIKIDELSLAQNIVEKLFSAIKPHLPAAGLAAPQIGIGRSVFIYSFDRDPAHLEGVINPSYNPAGEAKVEGWEGCFSSMLSEGTAKLAKVPRYETIHVQYTNVNGERVEKVLEGFAAKVFQHEYDHLQGTVNIDREDAVVKDFLNQEEMLKFMQEVKKEDSLRYKNPN